MKRYKCLHCNSISNEVEWNEAIRENENFELNRYIPISEQNIGGMFMFEVWCPNCGKSCNDRNEKIEEE